MRQQEVRQQEASQVVSGEIGLDALVGDHQVAPRLSRVENQTIKAWRSVHDLVRKGPNLSHERKITSQHLEIGIRYAASDSVCRSLASLGGACPYEDPRSAFAELRCDGLTNAARSAGDQKGGSLVGAA